MSHDNYIKQQYVTKYVTSNSCNTGKSALPDMHAQAQGRVWTYQAKQLRTSACVTTNMLHFQ